MRDGMSVTNYTSTQSENVTHPEIYATVERKACKNRTLFFKNQSMSRYFTEIQWTKIICQVWQNQLSISHFVRAMKCE